MQLLKKKWRLLWFLSPVSGILHCNLNAGWHPPFSLVLKVAWCLYWWKILYLPETGILPIVSAGLEMCLTRYLKGKIFLAVSAIAQNCLAHFPLLHHDHRALTDCCLQGRKTCCIPLLLPSQLKTHAVLDLQWQHSWRGFLVPPHWVFLQIEEGRTTIRTWFPCLRRYMPPANATPCCILVCHDWFWPNMASKLG